jgi:hypothetical protein
MKFIFLFLLTFLVFYFLIFAGFAFTLTLGGNVFALRTVLSIAIGVLVAWKWA